MIFKRDFILMIFNCLTFYLIFCIFSVKNHLQGVLATPDHSRTGELQTLNMKLRNELDLFANVVHVRSLPGVKTRHNVNITLCMNAT